MTQQMKCVHICDRNGKHTEEEPVNTHLGLAKRPKYPADWESKEDEAGERYMLCPECVKKYYENFHKFMETGDGAHN